ncbi:MAG: hypothetical protein F6J86_07110 [Symploca sp. SIO1B1]|nr:hypothetical protein [Symploca sp. SIO1B1]
MLKQSQWQFAQRFHSSRFPSEWEAEATTNIPWQPAQFPFKLISQRVGRGR